MHHSKSTSAPRCRKKIRKANQTSSTACIRARSKQPTQRTNTRTRCCASRDQNCIRSVRSRNTWKNLPYEGEHVHLGNAKHVASSNHTHAARDLAVRCSNKHSMTPWNREAVFQNLGVVQDLLRKWCHQFRTAAWPRRIMTTSLSQHHSNNTCHSWVVKETHTTTQIKMSAVTIAIKLYTQQKTTEHRFAFATDTVCFETPFQKKQAPHSWYARW